MDILNSLYTGLFGMSVVFAALVSLILLINLQTWLVGKMSGTKKSDTSKRGVPAVAAPVSNKPAAHAASVTAPLLSAEPQELKLTGVDEKTAAMIMAIVCDETGSAPQELYFKSIRLLED